MMCLVCGAMCLFGVLEDTKPAISVDLETLHDSASAPVVEGKDGWLFLRSELSFLTAGPFWGPHAIAVSKARKPDWADPEVAIIGFATQLDEAGIELLVVPVPAKATVMAEKLPAETGYDNDADLQSFLARLRASGVGVLDLKPSLRKLTEAGQPAYLQSDSHWSPVGMEASAETISMWLAKQGLILTPPNEASTPRTKIELRGDLVQMRDGGPGPPSEVASVSIPTISGSAVDRASPVLLLGDSHALVYSAGGDMHAQGAGLAEHLAAKIGMGVDRVAVRGSGATASRIELLRRRDHLSGKQFVVWVFAARDLTESDGWRMVPVMGGSSMQERGSPQ